MKKKKLIEQLDLRSKSQLASGSHLLLPQTLPSLESPHNTSNHNLSLISMPYSRNLHAVSSQQLFKTDKKEIIYNYDYQNMVKPTLPVLTNRRNRSTNQPSLTLTQEDQQQLNTAASQISSLVKSNIKASSNSQTMVSSQGVTVVNASKIFDSTVNSHNFLIPLKEKFELNRLDRIEKKINSKRT